MSNCDLNLEVAKDGREMFNEVWNNVTDDYIERVKICLLGTEENRFTCEYVADVIKNEVGQNIPNENESNHKVIYLHGGKNGDGNWIEYFNDISNIFEKLTIKTLGGFKTANLIKWDVDVADDVFCVWIGVNE